MILLLEADNEVLQYRLMDNNETIDVGRERSIKILKARLARLNKACEIKKVGYLVKNGGRSIDRTVTEKIPSLAAYIGEDLCFGSNSDMLMRELLIFCWECFANSRHFILGDSVFFMNMPRHTITYAIPREYTDEGIVKYGRNGIVHEWTSKKLASIKGAHLSKVITVYLNDCTDVVALKDGKPVMTSHGFSDFDGIMSGTGCGAVDTSIVFQLFSAGYSRESIQQILSQESGFKALVGDNLGFFDFIVGKDAKVKFARDIFSYQLVKTIGACAAILEGVDAIVFIGDDQKRIKDWVYDFLSGMEFLGFKKRKSRNHEDIALMTEDSSVEAYYFTLDKYLLMFELLDKQT